MHDGTDARAARIAPAQDPAAMPDREAMIDLIAAFHQVAAGVEGTHRVLLERVEELSRELESLRGQGPTVIAMPACDGTTTLADVERQAILATLDRFGGHRDRTAKALGIGVRTLGMKLQQWRNDGLVPVHMERGSRSRVPGPAA